ncbi:5'-nucleotidase C-terminal domain-containing protein [Lachnospiraceae bacterium MD1]|uniref:5'-nucleotidase C-terminal domain-containing protein n=1 Tax=Variimorphobacter saccharofermentans TaxID=2755051 RepID=A0A839K3U1_9FIRM|nr:5'-nucleotidase C-terminal domain-containing protein [Variimorphobacter saccharofermentans]MBB2184048.1 5'-nucleotidase C-terminal domain-containing protein [Variimorphobacter saccharofermentans]
MKHRRRIVSILLMLALVILPFQTVAAGTLPTGQESLAGTTVIMHTNDSHARAVPNSDSGYMGFTAVSALKKSYEAAGAQVILLDAGDTLHGLPFANLVKGESIVKIMNLAGYDAMTPGNHDFNYGSSTLKEISKNMNFPLLSSNIKNKSDNSDFLEDHIIIEKNGVKYGIFGLSTPETAYKTNPKNVTSIEFTNPVEAAKEEVKELEAEGAQVIIALAHLGLDESSEYTSKLVAEKVDGIDLIVDGHSHSVLEAGLTVGDTLIVSTGDYIQNIGVVIIGSDGAMKADLISASEYTGTDKAVDDKATEYQNEQEKLLSEVVGHTSVYLDGIREHVRAGETNLGDFTTDAFRYVTGADVAITNGGGIRASIEIGDISRKDLVTVFPFGNYVVTKKVTGEAILEALELGASTYPEPLGGFLQVSGITYTIDASKLSGKRISDVKVNGVAIDKKAEYLLATNDFIIAGGDGYTMLADFKVENEFGSIEDVLLEYLKEKGTINQESANRIKIVGLNAEVPEVTETPEVTEVPEVTDTEDESSEDSTYVVQKGDNLWKIAVKLFGDAGKWKKIYEWNKDTIKNPNLIYIGQELRIAAE